MIGFGRQLLGKASRAPGIKQGIGFGRRHFSYPAKRLARASTGTKTGARILASNPDLKEKLFQEKLLSTSSKAAKTRSAAAVKAKTRAVNRAKPKPDFYPRISNMRPGLKRGIGAGALVGIGAAGFASGVDDKNQVSNSVYDLAFGNPDYDKYVLGKKMGVRSLLAPIPGEMRMRGAMGAGTLIGQPAGSLLTGQTYTDAWRASRKNTPKVDGSVAFGMYNARLG